MAYLSTQASIEAKAGVNRVKLFGDKDRDGTIDATTLAQGLEYAQQLIYALLYPRYGSQVEDWDTDYAACPVLLKRLSDDIALYWLASSVPIVNPVMLENNNAALRVLSQLAGYEMSLPGIDDTTDYDAITDTMESVFDDDDSTDSESLAFSLVY